MSGNAVGSTHNAFRYLIVNINQVTGKNHLLNQSYAVAPQIKQNSSMVTSYLVQKSTKDGIRTLLDPDGKLVENALRIEIFPIPREESNPNKVLKPRRENHVWAKGNTKDYQLYFSLDIHYQTNLETFLAQNPNNNYCVYISDNKNEKRRYYFHMNNYENKLNIGIPSIVERECIKLSWQIEDKADELSSKTLAINIKNLEKCFETDNITIRQAIYKAVNAVVEFQNNPLASNLNTAKIAITELYQFSSSSNVTANLIKTAASGLVGALVLSVVCGAVGFLTMGAGVLPVALILGGILGAAGGGATGYFLFFKPDDNSRLINEDCQAMHNYVNNISLVPA